MKQTWLTRQSTRFFWSLVRDMPLNEFIILLSCGKTIPNFYVFDHVERSACVFRPGGVPWPVEYILGHHHPKHVLQSKRRVSLQTLGQALFDWEHRLRWKFALANKRPNPWQFLRGRSDAITPCDFVLPRSFSDFCNDTRSAIYNEILKTRGRTKSCRSLFNNLFGVIRLGLQLLKIGPYQAIRTDKDGGFVLVAKEVLLPEKLRLLSNSDRYFEVSRPPDFSESVVRGFVNTVLSNCPHHLQGEDKTEFLSSILHSIRGRSGRAFSKLKCTLKTHKDPGSVSWRGIHSTVKSPFSSAISFVVSCLRPILSSLDHLLKNSEALVKKLGSLPVPEDSHFMKIDVKEFFMEGLHSQFVRYSTEFVDPQWRHFYRSVLQYLLETQFVEVEDLDTRLWKTLKGSGMGLGFSGELADITFFASVEKRMLEDRRFLQQHAVHLYVRFKDDIFVILGGTHRSRVNFGRFLREQSSVWTLELESVSKFSCSFLDLNISKGARWKSTGLLDVGIHHKPTGLHQPLAPHSAHSPHVHSAWPRGLLARARRLCNTKSLFHEECLHLKRLLSARFGTTYADSILKHVPKRPPSFAHQDFVTSRLVIPYHREWDVSRVRSVLRMVQERHQSALLSDFGSPIRVQICYSLAGPHLYLRLAKL